MPEIDLAALEKIAKAAQYQHGDTLMVVDVHSVAIRPQTVLALIEAVREGDVAKSYAINSTQIAEEALRELVTLRAELNFVKTTCVLQTENMMLRDFDIDRLHAQLAQAREALGVSKKVMEDARVYVSRGYGAPTLSEVLRHVGIAIVGIAAITPAPASTEKKT